MSADNPHDQPWWFWPLLPVTWLIAPFALVILGTWTEVYWSLYPEWHAHVWDGGTARQQEYMRRLRRYTSRVSVWTRLGRVLMTPIRGDHFYRNARRRARQKLP